MQEGVRLSCKVGIWILPKPGYTGECKSVQKYNILYYIDRNYE